MVMIPARTFLMIIEAGQFRDAAQSLSVAQQMVIAR
jgi:DNA-binding transcriptional LysR family regulator